MSVDWLIDRLGAGESPALLAEDYGLPLAAVEAVEAWRAGLRAPARGPETLTGP